MDMITLAMAKAYTDKKAGYVEVSEAVIFENLAVSGGEADTTVTTQMIPGKTYIVTVGGVKYERVCYTEAFDGIACVGNARLYDFVNEDNGDDFFVGQARETIVQCYTRNMGDTTITLAEKTETIHPIDPKYLPGVCLPVLELSQETMAGVFASGNASCTAEEHAIIWGAYQALYPLIIKGNYNGIAFSGVSNILLDESSNPYFMADAGEMKLQVSFDDKTANVRSVQQ